jgi:hypothetical protein
MGRHFVFWYYFGKHYVSALGVRFKQRSHRSVIGWVTIHTYIPLTLYPRRGSRGILDITHPPPTFYQNYLAMRNTADVTGGKPIAVWSQSISTVSASCPSGIKREWYASMYCLNAFPLPYLLLIRSTLLRKHFDSNPQNMDGSSAI